MLGPRGRARRGFKLLILHLLRDKPLHVYGLIKSLEKITGLKPSPGAIYPALKALERAGLVEAQEVEQGGRRSRVFRLTEEGARYLEERGEELEEALRAASCWRSFRELGGERLFRAVREVMENLPRLSEGQREELRKAIAEFELRVLSILHGSGES
jgi:DNA-binding PadR family transcriptional regulator